jgi:hypothetical protein
VKKINSCISVPYHFSLKCGNEKKIPTYMLMEDFYDLGIPTNNQYTKTSPYEYGPRTTAQEQELERLEREIKRLTTVCINI